MTWLGISIVLSLLLTIVLNVGLRMFPDAGRRAARGLAPPSLPGADEGRERNHRVRVWVPWKAMIVGSVILTIVVNLLLWIARD
jgi:glycerol uptake facilitator-like aquaporin